MNIHKNTRLTPHNRQAIWRAYTQDKISVTSLARQYHVSKRSLYNPPAACVAPPPTLPVDSCVGCVPSGTHALFGLYRSGRLKANAFRRPFLPNFIRYPAALCVLVRETLDSTQPAVRRSSEWPNNRQFLSYARFCRCVG